MKYVSYLVVAAATAAALAGCADPYYPRYGYSQASYYPASYSYPATYSYPVVYSYPASYSYPSSYGNPTTAYEYRNYNGIHPGPERTYLAVSTAVLRGSKATVERLTDTANASG